MAIDVGSACVNGTGESAVNYTHVSNNNLANADGTIDYVCVWSSVAMTDQEVASFYGSNPVSTRAYVSLANQGSAGKTEYNAPGDFTAFSINTGDGIGQYRNAGKLRGTNSGGAGLLYKAGDNIPCSSTTFTFVANWLVSLYATGNESSTTLTVAELNSSGTLDNVALTQKHSLAVSELLSSGSLDNVPSPFGEDGTLKYWLNGTPCIVDDDANLKALKYWSNGSPNGIPLCVTETGGWTGTINGVTNPAKINGIAVGDIAKVNGVS